MRIENLIVKGKGFLQWQLDEHNSINKLKNNITHFMHMKGYTEYANKFPFIQDNFFSITYELHLNTKEEIIPLKLRFKRFFGLISKEDIETQQYLSAIGKIAPDTPFLVYFCFTYGKYKERVGFFVDIRSEPMLKYHIKQLGKKHRNIEEFEHSLVLDTNKNFLYTLFKGLYIKILEEPKCIGEFIKTPIIEKLDDLEIKEVADILKNGKSKLEKGEIEDSLTDLRSSLEIFIKILVEKIGEKPGLKLKNNLDILKEKGYIDEEISFLISNVLNTWLYRYLSLKAVHKREKINIIDARFMFSVAEESINLLIEKVIYRV